MPYKSQAQAGYFHTHKAELEKQGVNVDEWDAATKGKSLPKRAAQGGPVKSVDQDTGDHIPKGEAFNHKRFAGGGQKAEGGIGGHNDGHGIYAHGGPVLKEGNDRFYKSPTRSPLGQFLGKTDRFTSGRQDAGAPESQETSEEWEKPRGVGQREADDSGDCKTLPPVRPHSKGGHYNYAKGARQTTTDTFHEDPRVQETDSNSA